MMFPVLQLPIPLHLPFESESAWWIYDCVRKKEVVCTPEEWVRQHMIQYLIVHRNYVVEQLSVEKKIRVAKHRVMRCDVLAYNAKREVEILIECKAPTISLTAEHVRQLQGYQYYLGVSECILTNGIDSQVFGETRQEKM